MIDRLVRGYVVDFVEPLFIDFPNFNIADAGITCGIICVLISFSHQVPCRVEACGTQRIGGEFHGEKTLEYGKRSVCRDASRFVPLFEAGLYPTRSKAVKQIEAGKVFLNGKEPTKKDIVNEGDLVIYEELVEEMHVYLEPEDIPLEVYYRR